VPRSGCFFLAIVFFEIINADGVSIMMVSRSEGTATTPRAHITNVAALECLRDVGLETECKEQATPSEYIRSTRWAESLLGREYGRVYAWGHDPARKVGPMRTT
jgi:hypothetical protein